MAFFVTDTLSASSPVGLFQQWLGYRHSNTSTTNTSYEMEQNMTVEYFAGRRTLPIETL